jgi:choline kinase
MNAIILAAEGAALMKSRILPSCLQPVMGGTNMLDQQTRLLNIFGIPSNQIYVVIGSTGSWSLKQARNELDHYPQLNIVTNSSNDKTASEYSFYAAFDKCKDSKDLVVVNSDAIFDIRQLERLCTNKQSSSVLTKKPTSVNERGIKLKISESNKLTLCKTEEETVFPWLLFAGVLFIAKSDLARLSHTLPVLDTDGLIYSLDESLGIHTFENVDYNSMEITLKAGLSSIDLRGGSFASLERKHLVRKEARGNGFEKLTDEIDWLLSLPPNLSQLFPQVVNTERTGDSAWFEMPWYDAPCLRKNILTGIYSPESTWILMKQVLEFMFSEVYINIYEKKVNGVEWLFLKHIIRVRDRISQIYNANSVMRDLISSPKLSIDGDIYMNVPECLLIIANRIDFLKNLSPKSLRMIHGDFHFQNILVQYSGNTHGFLLADPRGELLGSDLYYDMGKLWHSFNGKYDLIHTDLCIVNQVNHFGSIRNFNLDYTNKQMLDTYSHIKGMASSVLEEYDEISNDEYWYFKTLFAEAMHFCSVSAFHLRSDGIENRAKCLYLRGVQLINQFISLTKLSNYNEDISLIKVHNLDEWAEELGHPSAPK